MSNDDNLISDVELLRGRLSQLSEASLRLVESLDFEKVLQVVIDTARSLTGARYGGMVLCDELGWVSDYVTSGAADAQVEQFWTMPGVMSFQRYFQTLSEPLRTADFGGYLREHGLQTTDMPMAGSGAMPLLAAAVRLRDEVMGAIYLGERDRELWSDGDAPAFSETDQETLVTLASQAALVISNARRHREEQRARADLETLLSTVPVGVLVFDSATGAPASTNPEAGRVFADLGLREGTPADLLASATFWNSDGQKIPTEGLPYVRSLMTGETVRAEEIVIESASGKRITTLLNSTPIRNDSGEVESAVVTIQDMSPIADLDRLRAEFLGIIGHELRTPLSSIKGSAATLIATESMNASPEAAQYHRIISDQADYMRDLIADLIDIVRIETGSLSVVPSPNSLAQMADDARSMFLSAGGQDNLRISVDIALPEVMADRRRIVQVINNLLTNAERNSDDASPIRIEASRDGVYVAVSVSDNGRGIPADRIPMLFHKFARSEGFDRANDLGLGLAICKGIVEAHGGRIWAESGGPGLGSRFTFTLPAADGEDAGEQPAGTSAAGGIPSESVTQVRVLAVDDDPRALRHIGDALALSGFEAELTGDPLTVESLVVECDPDVVLLDLMLPGTDGLELMHDVFAHVKIPVIFLSAYDQQELIARAFELGAVDYIVKPFSPSELAARIRAALRKHANQVRTFTIGDLVVDESSRSVAVAGKDVEVTPIEFALLVELSANVGAALTHEQLLQRVWGTTRLDDARPLRTAIKNIRHKLGDGARSPQYIVTVPRVGYRMRRPAPPES